MVKATRFWRERKADWVEKRSLPGLCFEELFHKWPGMTSRFESSKLEAHTPFSADF
jgi:hypothetical protein